MEKADVVVIGAGFGGLASALRLAELGADVVLCETLRYPGGCASTFTRSGYQFEAGATLFSGLGDGQLFSNWNDKWDLGVRFDPLDPLVELRTGQWSLAIPPDPERRSFVAFPSCLALIRKHCATSLVRSAAWPTHCGSCSKTRPSFRR